MKNVKSVSLLAICVLVVSFPLSADSPVNGLVLSSNWGLVYLGFTSNSFGIAYETSNRYGIMEGQFENTTKIFKGNWSELDLSNTLRASGTIELQFDDTSFRGTWYKYDGSFGGNWNGTGIRDFNDDDVIVWRAILARFGVYP